MELQIDDAGTLREVYFNGDGCCISQAAASMLVEKFDGRTVEEVKKFTANDMLDLFGVRLTPNRQKCCLLPWRVLQAAIYSPVATRSTGPRAPGAGVRPAEPVTTWNASAAFRQARRINLERRKGVPYEHVCCNRAAPGPRDLPPRFSHPRPRGPRRTCRWSISTTPPPRSGRGR